MCNTHICEGMRCVSVFCVVFLKKSTNKTFFMLSSAETKIYPADKC